MSVANPATSIASQSSSDDAVGFPSSKIFLNRTVKQNGFLWDIADRRPKTGQSCVPYVHPINAYDAFVHVVQPCDELGDSTLATPAAAHQRNLFACSNLEV